MIVKLKDIISFFNDEIIGVFGNPDNIIIKYIKSPEDIDEYSLDWIDLSKTNKQQIAEMSKAKVVITDKSVYYSKELHHQEKVLIHVQNPKAIIASIGKYFFSHKSKIKIHKTAIIHSKAQIGKNVSIGPYSSLGICKVGENTVINSNVCIHDDVVIGKGVKIGSGTVLGSDGFGIEKDLNGNYYRFPQLSGLCIHDNVEIGANTCIDKGSLTDTIIGEGSKISNLCQIAHNVKIGKNVIITGQVMISGSCVIQDNVWISPNVTIRDHIQIGKGAFIGLGAVVIKNIPPNETWIGHPANKIEK